MYQKEKRKKKSSVVGLFAERKEASARHVWNAERDRPRKLRGVYAGDLRNNSAKQGHRESDRKPEGGEGGGGRGGGGGGGDRQETGGSRGESKRRHRRGKGGGCRRSVGWLRVCVCVWREGGEGGRGSGRERKTCPAAPDAPSK